MKNGLGWVFFHSCAHATKSLPEQIIFSENFALDNSGKVWVYTLSFSSNRAMTRQKRDTKSSTKKQFDFLTLLRKNKKAAGKMKKSKKLGYLSIGERQQILLLTNLNYSASDIAVALGCGKRTVYRT
jgi:hypothetical protein